MNQTTEPPMANQADKQEISSFYMARLLLLSALILLLTRLPQEVEEFKLPSTGFVFTIFPYIYASGQTIRSALIEFSSGTPGPVTFRLTTYALGSLLIGFVISPAILFFSLRRSLLKVEQPRLPRALSLFGITFTISLLLMSIPAAFVQRNLHDNLKRAQLVQSVKDDMLNTVNLIAQDARVFRILPKQLGGGEGSFEGFALPPQLAKSEWVIFSVRSTKDVVVITGTVTKDPIFRYEIAMARTHAARVGKPGEFSEAGVSVTLDTAGLLREWNYTGIFK